MIVRVLLYVVLGLALLLVNIWYVARVRKAFFSRSGPDTIAPFQLIGKDDPEGRNGAAMARMLHARLSSIQREVESARDALRASLRVDLNPAPAVVPVVGVGEERRTVREIERRLSLRLYDPPHIALQVYGVELGGLLAWVQGTLSADQSLRIVVQYGQSEARVGGAFGDDPAQSIWLRTKADDEDIISKIGYSLWQQEMARDVPEVAALDPLEFGELVGFLVRFAELSRQDAIVERDPKRWEDLLPTVLKLGESVPGWDDLQQLAGLVAMRARQPAQAARSFEAARVLVTRALRRCEEQLAALGAAPAGPATGAGERGRLTAQKADLEAHLQALNGALELIGRETRPPQAGLVGDPADAILTLLDARAIKPSRPVKVAVFGGVPPLALRQGLAHREVQRGAAASEGGFGEYVGQLSHTIAAMAQGVDLEFLYAPLSADALESSAPYVEDAIGSLVAEHPDILVVAVRLTPDWQRRLAKVIEAAVEANVVVILSAGNQGGEPLPFTGQPLARRVLIVSAADRHGARLPFSQQGPESVWAPGSQIPTLSPGGDRPTQWDGTGPAAAVAAGVVGRILSARPSVKVDDLTRQLRQTAAPPAENADGVPLIQAGKALKRLAQGS